MTVPSLLVSVYSSPHPPLISPEKGVSRSIDRGTSIIAPGCDTSTKRAHFLNLIIPCIYLPTCMKNLTHSAISLMYITKRCYHKDVSRAISNNTTVVPPH